jgi:WD40 repeat protein/energy-coupling factor transporter ATP-binding protein EcfA2
MYLDGIVTPAEGIRMSHVFLSHAGADTQAAHQFAEILRRNGLNVWFDKDNLGPGDPWMATIERAISNASAMLVYVGRLGVESWVDREVRLGLVRNTQNREAFLLIPVLGEGAELERLPPFLLQHQCADLRESGRAPEQIRRLIEVLQTPSSQAAIPANYWTEHSPFRSLQIFGPEDSWLFFGRDRDTDELLDRLRRTPTLAVVGNSGSGKSSLIQAGLIPALRRGRFRYDGRWVDSWRIAILRPSATPFDYLAEVLPRQLAPELSLEDRTELTGYYKQKLPEGGETLRNVIANLNPAPSTSSEARVLLVVDQFEELFTLVEKKATRDLYIELLLAAARLDTAVPVHLVLALRADFYANCLDHPQLSTAIAANLYNVPRISPEQLRETIENRLALAAARAEPGLMDSLLADVGTEPGNLALLEHALAQVWEKCGGSGSTLTSDAYTKINRLRGALGRHADDVYDHLQDENEKRLAQRIFLELVQLGEGAQDTRRRVAKEVLLHLGPREQVERLIGKLASNRLLATSGEGPQSATANFVEVSHEALIREWPALREWVRNNRDDLRLERVLRQAAEEWWKLKKDPGALTRGVRLAEGREWLANRPDADPLLREFLEASWDAEEEAARKEREAQEREIARQKELREQAEARAQVEERLRQEAERRRQAEQTAAAKARDFQEREITRQKELREQAERLRVTEESAAAGARRSAARLLRLSLALASLVLVAAGVAVYARYEQLTAQSGALAARAELMIADDQTSALDLALQAWSIKKTSEANLAVLHAFSKPVVFATNSGSILDAAFSRDGNRIVTASGDKTARVWNAASGELLITLAGHLERVLKAAFSPDGDRIVTASEDRTARVWNAASGKLLVTLSGHSEAVLSAAFSPDSQHIVTTSLDRTVRVWDAASGKPLVTLEGNSLGVEMAAFSPDGQRIFIVSGDSTAQLWNAFTGELLVTLTGHSGFIQHAGFSPDGARIVTAGEDTTARVWNTTSGQLLLTLKGHSKRVLNAALSPDGEHIVTTSSDTTARVWNASNGQLLLTLKGHSKGVFGVAFSPRGDRIVTASEDGTTRVWNSANGQLLLTLTDPNRFVEFSPDGQRILIVFAESYAQVWNTVSGELLVRLSEDAQVRHAAFSPDGQRIVTASDQSARVWNATSGRELITFGGRWLPIWSAAFSPDGQRIVTAHHDDSARVWSSANGKLLLTLTHNKNSVASATFSPDGQRIVTASFDDGAQVWDIASGRLLVTLSGHSGSVRDAAFSPGGDRIVTASNDRTARVWNAATGEPLVTLSGHMSYVNSAAFSPDGDRIVTASHDGTARVWNAATGELLVTLSGHSGFVWGAAFSPKGDRIVTASEDRTARVWNAVTGQLVVTLSGHLARVVSAAFSPDGQRIVTASEDWTARIYRLLTLTDLPRVFDGEDRKIGR